MCGPWWADMRGVLASARVWDGCAVVVCLGSAIDINVCAPCLVHLSQRDLWFMAYVCASVFHCLCACVSLLVCVCLLCVAAPLFVSDAAPCPTLW